MLSPSKVVVGVPVVVIPALLDAPDADVGVGKLEAVAALPSELMDKGDAGDAPEIGDTEERIELADAAVPAIVVFLGWTLDVTEDKETRTNVMQLCYSFLDIMCIDISESLFRIDKRYRDSTFTICNINHTTPTMSYTIVLTVNETITTYAYAA